VSDAAAPDGYAVRAAAPPDAGAIADLMNALAEAQGGAPAMTASRAADTLFDARFGLTAHVATAGPEIVAYATHRIEFESAFAAVGRYLSDLYVAPAHRRRGLARALIRTVAQAAAAEGGTFVWWLAKADAPGARALYRRLADVETPVAAFAVTRMRFAQLVEDGRPH